MRARMGVGKFELQWGTAVIEPDGSSIINTDVAATSDSPASVILTPFDNVSVAPHLQTPDLFIVTNSDTAPVTASYVFASTRR